MSIAGNEVDQKLDRIQDEIERWDYISEESELTASESELMIKLVDLVDRITKGDIPDWDEIDSIMTEADIALKNHKY